MPSTSEGLHPLVFTGGSAPGSPYEPPLFWGSLRLCAGQTSLSKIWATLSR